MYKHLDHKHELLLESILAVSLPRSLRWSDAVEDISVSPHDMG
jgi:hypothetical protein